MICRAPAGVFGVGQRPAGVQILQLLQPRADRRSGRCDDCRRRRRGGCRLRGRGLLFDRSAYHRLDLGAQGRVRPDVDHLIERNVVGLEDLQDLHQRARLPTQVVGLVVLGHGELRGHQAVDQSASLPVDSVLAGGGVDQDHDLAGVEVAEPGDAGDHPVFAVERQDSGSGDAQVHLDDLLVVHPRPRLGDPGDLSERQHPVLLERGHLGRRLGAIVRQRERDQHVNHGDQQADVEHPLQQAVEPYGEVHDQEDRSDQAAAQQNHQLCLQVAR